MTFNILSPTLIQRWQVGNKKRAKVGRNLAAAQGNAQNAKEMVSQNPSPTEDLAHLLTMCRATADTRILPQLLDTVASSDPRNSLLTSTTYETLTQFLLDCSSLNLPANTRVPPNHPGFVNITKQCSNLINGIHKERTRQMKALGLLGRI